MYATILMLIFKKKRNVIPIQDVYVLYFVKKKDENLSKKYL